MIAKGVGLVAMLILIIPLCGRYGLILPIFKSDLLMLICSCTLTERAKICYIGIRGLADTADGKLFCD